MKIKNILALGLITIVSGISTAQTYNATAGTNGTTDIQNDYSIATGEGASVSVDVPLEFELPKKVAIATRVNGGSLPSLDVFNGISHYLDTNSSYNVQSKGLSLSPSNSSSWNNVSVESVGITGGIYANTSINLEFSNTDFLHESDSNSSFKARPWIIVGKSDNGNREFGILSDDNDSSTTIFPASLNISDTDLASTGNKLSFAYGSRAYLDTIDPTDRAGKYTSIATITVSTL